MARINSPSDIGFNSDSLDVGNDIGSGIENIKIDNLVCGVGYHSDPLDVDNDIGSPIELVKVEYLVSGVGCNIDSLDVCNDISSRIEQIKVEGPIDFGEDKVPCTSHGTVSLERRSCSHMASARRDASESSCDDGSERLHTLVNVDVDVRLASPVFHH